MVSNWNENDTARETAIRLLCSSNLHRCLWLPQSDSHERIRMTFSTTSNFDADSLPAALFAGPMFGSRYMAASFDKIAEETGVRMIFVDRPGIGGSSHVDLDQRINVWLEAVPAILDRLKVDHVALVSHSAGTLYALNTIARLRSILHPDSPYVALLGPWVANEHSNVTLMNIVSSLPTGVFDGWAGLQQFVNSRIMPATTWSGGVLSSVSSLFQAQPGVAGVSSSHDKYGVDKATEKHIDLTTFQYLTAEGLSGANDEARLCVKKGPVGAWGACEDYMHFVRMLADSEREHSSEATNASKLRVRVHYAASDMMIGKGGQEYFDKCWNQSSVADAIDMQSKEWPDTNHETVLLDLRKGATRSVLEDVAHLCSA